MIEERTMAVNIGAKKVQTPNFLPKRAAWPFLVQCAFKDDQSAAEKAQLIANSRKLN